MANFLAFDLGTTYLKAGLFDERGQTVASARRPLNADRPLPGRLEIAPKRFQRLLAGLIEDLGERERGLEGVAAVTFASQTNSFLLLGDRDCPVTPIILWPDERALPAADDILPLLRSFLPYKITGIPEISHQFMTAKLLWLQKTNPNLWSSAKRLCLIGDYLALWMTGCHATEAGVAGLTGLLDIHRLAWQSQACERFGISPSWLPECLRAGTDLGPIRAEVAQRLRLPRGCRFIVGCLDQYAGAIGAGNIMPGGISETTGTVLATVRCAQGFNPEPPRRVFQGPGFSAETFFQMIFGDVSANLLEAYRNSLPDQPEFDALIRTAEEVAPGAEGLRIGSAVKRTEGAPIFHGWAERHGRGHAVRAILEAVAFALAGQVDELCGGRRPKEIRSLGGAARNAFWRQLKADVLDCPLVAVQCSEPTGMGAAMLAAVSLGLGDLPQIAAQWIRLGAKSLPDARNHQAYRTMQITFPESPSK
ncbi:MAG: FGGY-family carbohydrate kinase [Pirellulales bacterium]|nr:FGGY-family carbohydrate kinase [Pirellulales bacterium]